MQPVDELARLRAELVGRSVVANDVVRTPGLFLDRQLRREASFGFRARHPPCRHHPFDLGLAGGSDATYYIKILLPLHLEEEGDYRDAKGGRETGDGRRGARDGT